MRRIAISAGHSNIVGKDRGAVNLIIEGDETVILRDLIVKEFKLRNEPVSIDNNSNITSQTVALFRQYFGASDILLDIHFNASINSKATGTEVLIPAKYTDFEYMLAKSLSSGVSKILNIKDRGVITELQSARKKLMWMSIPGENILLEVCFISNPLDIENYNNKKIGVAKIITDILLSYKNK